MERLALWEDFLAFVSYASPEFNCLGQSNLFDRVERNFRINFMPGLNSNGLKRDSKSI